MLLERTVDKCQILLTGFLMQYNSVCVTQERTLIQRLLRFVYCIILLGTLTVYIEIDEYTF